MNKKIIFGGIITILLIAGLIFVSANTVKEEIVVEPIVEESTPAACGATCGINSACGGTCGGSCGVKSCGCGS